MKLAALATLASSAAAFAPARTGPASTSLRAFEQERFDRLRYVEIKHGRIAMLGFLGNIVTRAGFHWDNAIDFAGRKCETFPNGWAALWGPDAIPVRGAAQIFSLIGLMEVAFMKDIPGTGNEFPGDLRNGWIDFGWDTFDEEQKLFKRGVELNNGRAAIMA